MSGRAWSLPTAYAALGVAAVIVLLPSYVMFTTSITPTTALADGSASPWIVGTAPTLDHYARVFRDYPFTRIVFNTTLVAIAVVAITLVASVLAAFAITRMGFRGSTVFATGVFLSYLVPEGLIFIPLFKMTSSLGLLDTLWAVILVIPTLSIPFCTWLLIGYFGAIPRELDEAAIIDGASWPQILWFVFLPVATPGLIAAALFSFTLSWSSFLYPLGLIFSADRQLLAPGVITLMIRGDVMFWGELTAAALMTAAPPVVLYALLMNYYVSGLTAGAAKG